MPIETAASQGFPSVASSPTIPGVLKQDAAESPVAPTTSKTGAFLANAAANVLPSLAAMGVGSAVGGATSSMTPVVGIPAGIGAGMAAGAGANALQEKLLPQAAVDYLQRARQEHNLASAFGNVVGGGAVVRPSVEGTKQLGSGIINLISRLAGPAARTEMTPGQVGTLVNAGIGAGVPAAVAGYHKFQGQDVDPAELAIEMAGGGLSTSPTKLGRMVGVHPTITDEQYRMLEQEGPGTLAGQEIAENVAKLPDEVPPRLEKQSLGETRIDEPKLDAEYEKQLTTAPVDVVPNKKSATQELKLEAQQEALANDPEELAKAVTRKENEDAAKIAAENEKLKIADEKRRDALRKELETENQASILGEQEVEKTKAMREVTPEPRELPPVENTREVALAGQPAKVPASENSEVPYPFFQQVRSELMSKPATKSMLEYFKKLGANFRNYKVEEDNSITHEGQPVRGVALVRKGIDDTLIKVSRKDANQETLPHEAFHAFWNYLKSVAGVDVAGHAQKIENVVKDSPAFKEWSAKNQGDVEEFLTSKVGQATVQKLSEQDSPFRSGLRDAASALKARLTQNPDDYARLFARKLLLDPKNVEAGGKQEGTAAKTQPITKGESTDSESLDLSPEKFSTLKSIGSAIKPAVDKVAELGPTGKRAAEGLKNFFARQDKLEAQFLDVPLKELSKQGVNKSEIQEAADYMRDRFRGENVDDTILSQGAKKAVDVLQPLMKSVREYQNQVGLPVFDANGNPHKGAVSEHYWPDMLSTDAVRVFTQEPESARAQKAKEVWADHVVEQSKGKVSHEDALQKINDYVSALGNSTGSQYFNALTKVRGFGIPEALREQDALHTLARYGRRSAKTLAYYEELQKHPDIAAALKVEQPSGATSPDVEGVQNISGSTPVVNAMKFVTDEFPRRRAPVFQSLQRVLTNGLLGPVSGAKDVASVPFLAAPYLQHVEDLGAFGKALKGWKDYAKESLEYGSRNSRLDYKRWNNILDESSTVERLNNIANALRKYQGRDLLEQSSRIFTHGLGVELAKLNLARSLGGDSKATKWLENFSTLNEKPIAEWGQQELAQVGKNFTDRLQGTYDARGLPAGMFDHPVASTLFPLQRWSIERFNNIHKDVIQPAKRGDFKPLLLATIGSAVGGKVVGELAQFLNGKKQSDPTVSEALESGNKEQEIATVVALMQMGSYMGIAGDIAKTATDLLVNKRTPQLSGNPLAGGVENLVDATVDARQALDNGESPISVMSSLIPEFLINQVQALRVGRNHLSEETQSKEDARDLSVFRKLQGTSTPQDSYRPMQGVASKSSERAFDKEADLNKLPAEASTLVQQAIESSKDGSGNIDIQKLTSKLRGLKSSSEDTKIFPSEPQEQSSYLNFLNRNQGEAEAQRRLQAYFKLKGMKEFKSSLIPALSQ